MDWVKLTTDYYRDFAIAIADDAAEVMFTRGIALCGETESGGFIPEPLLHTLTRRPQHAKRTAHLLTHPTIGDPVWEEVSGGYQVINWQEIQAELEKLVAKKRRDRDRKRRSRGQSDPVSTDVSADSPADGHEDPLYDSESKSKTAAAAAGKRPPPQPVDELPGQVQILRTKLNARKLTVRWDKLTTDHVNEITALVDLHGDGPLIKAALNSFRPDSPPVYAQAWLGDWRAIPQPGSLRVVDAPPCLKPGHQGTTARCGDCIIEDKIAEGHR